MVWKTTSAVAFVASALVAAACQRAHVDLNRPCANDGDCAGDAICLAGSCSDPSNPSCVPSVEVCDGEDNDCDGNADEGFECVLGGSESCGADGTVRLCKSDCTLSACVTGWLDGAWPHRVLVTINGSLVDSDFLEAVVPLRIPASNLTSEVSSVTASLTTFDGRDVRITDAAGSLLRHQVESWDPTRGFVVWVELHQLKRGEARSVYLYVGNTHATDASTNAIWDDDYVGVWHMAEDVETATLADASPKENAAQGITTSPSPAVFGSGQHYNGSEGAQSENAGIPASSDLTIEGWFTPQVRAQPYRRTLTATLQVADVQALWPIPGDITFQVHTAPDYSRMRVVDDSGQLPFTVLLTDHGTELWVRAPEAGSKKFALVYGQDGLADGSNGPATFPFWAADDRWSTLFTPQPSATSSVTSNGLALSDGRMSAQVPVDLRGGYFVQTYANYSQMGGETRNSGGLPHLSSVIAPSASLNGVSGVWVARSPGIAGGIMRTSTGAGTGFDQASDQDLPFLTNDVGIGIINNTASVFVDQVLARQTACAWANPLQFLHLGSYDALQPYYFTNYIVMFARRWPGATPLLSSSRERVGGLAIGDFAVGAQPGNVYGSTNAGTDFDGMGGAPAPHHVALVVRGTTAVLYVDAEEKLSLSANSHGALQGFSLGDAFAVNGTVDEVRLSQTARTPELFELQVSSSRNDFVSVAAVETLE